MGNSKYAGKKCFVIMPFGKKKDIDGTEIDFDYVYHQMIEKAVEDLGVDCERCDEIPDTGAIHKKMFKEIFDADVSVVDVTSSNPNVFYELGVRHALHKHVTLVIRKNSNQAIPFNIRGLNIMGYDIENEEQLDTAKTRIRELIQTGLDNQNIDSIVHDALDDEIKVERKSIPIKRTNFHTYELKEIPGKLVGIVTGDIQNIKDIDVWVNSENTNMQMARHYDRSISGTIRYMGAKKDAAKRVTDDVIAIELDEIVGKRGVDPAVVIPTGAGELTKTNGVKKIFHAAAVRGQVGRGYVPIADIYECVRNALELADSPEMENEDLHSIVFPLMGTGTTKLSPQEITNKLIDTAVSYIEENPDSRINKIYFLAYNQLDFELCEHTFINDPRIKTPEGTL